MEGVNANEILIKLSLRLANPKIFEFWREVILYKFGNYFMSSPLVFMIDQCTIIRALKGPLFLWLKKSMMQITKELEVVGHHLMDPSNTKNIFASPSMDEDEPLFLSTSSCIITSWLPNNSHY